MSNKSGEGKSLKGEKSAANGGGIDIKGILSALSNSGIALNNVTLQNAVIYGAMADDISIGQISPSSGAFTDIRIGQKDGTPGSFIAYGDTGENVVYAPDGSIVSVTPGDSVSWDPVNAIWNIMGALKVRDPSQFGNIIIYENKIEAVNEDGNVEIIPQSTAGSIMLSGNVVQTSPGKVEFAKATEILFDTTGKAEYNSRYDTLISSERGDVTIKTDVRYLTDIDTIIYTEKNSKIVTTYSTGQTGNEIVTVVKYDQEFNKTLDTVVERTFVDNIRTKCVKTIKEKILIDGRPATKVTVKTDIFIPATAVEEEKQENYTETRTTFDDEVENPIVPISGATTTVKSAVITTVQEHRFVEGETISTIGTNTIPSFNGNNKVGQILSPKSFKVETDNFFEDGTGGRFVMPQNGMVNIHAGSEVNFEIDVPVKFGNPSIIDRPYIEAETKDNLVFYAKNVDIKDPIVTLQTPSNAFSDSGIAVEYTSNGTVKSGFFGFIDSTQNFTWIPQATIVRNENGTKEVSGEKGVMELKGITLEKIIGNPNLELYTPDGSIIFNSKDPINFQTTLTFGESGKIVPSDDGLLISSDKNLTFYSGNKINLNATDEINIPTNVPLNFSPTTSISSNSSGDRIDITSNNNGQIGLNGNVHLQEDKKFQIGDNLNSFLQGDDGNVTLKAGNILNLSATDKIRIPDDILLQIGDTNNTGFIAHEGNLTTKSTNDYIVLSGGNYTQTSTNDFTQISNGKLTTIVSGDITTKSGGDLYLQVDGGQITTTATQLILPSESEIIFGDTASLSTAGTKTIFQSDKPFILDAVDGISLDGHDGKISMSGLDGINMNGGEGKISMNGNDGVIMNGGVGNVVVTGGSGISLNGGSGQIAMNGNNGVLINGGDKDVEISGDNIDLNAADIIQIPAETKLKFGENASIYTASTGALHVENPQGVVIDRNMVINGDLTVGGQTTEIVSTKLTLEDPIITLGISSANETVKDRGMEFLYGEGKRGFMGFSQEDDRFYMIRDGENNNEVFTKDKLGDLQVKKLYADMVVTGEGFRTSEITGNPDITLNAEQIKFLISKDFLLPFDIPITFGDSRNQIYGTLESLNLTSPLVDVKNGKMNLADTFIQSTDSNNDGITDNLNITGAEKVNIEAQLSIPNELKFTNSSNTTIKLDSENNLNISVADEEHKVIFPQGNVKIGEANILQTDNSLLIKNVDEIELDAKVLIKDYLSFSNNVNNATSSILLNDNGDMSLTVSNENAILIPNGSLNVEKGSLNVDNGIFVLGETLIEDHEDYLSISKTIKSNGNLEIPNTVTFTDNNTSIGTNSSGNLVLTPIENGLISLPEGKLLLENVLVEKSALDNSLLIKNLDLLDVQADMKIEKTLFLGESSSIFTDSNNILNLSSTGAEELVKVTNGNLLIGEALLKSYLNKFEISNVEETLIKSRLDIDNVLTFNENGKISQLQNGNIEILPETGKFVTFPEKNILLGTTEIKQIDNSLNISNVDDVYVDANLHIPESLFFGNENSIQVKDENLVINSNNNVQFPSPVVIEKSIQLGPTLLKWDEATGKLIWTMPEPPPELELNFNGVISGATWKGAPVSMDYGGTGSNGPWTSHSVVYINNDGTKMTQDKDNFIYNDVTKSLGIRTNNPTEAITLGSGNLLVSDGNVNLTSGDISLTSGNISLTLGNLSIIKGNVNLSDGNVSLTHGNVSLEDGDVLLTAGDVLLTSGDIKSTNGSIFLDSIDSSIIYGNSWKQSQNSQGDFLLENIGTPESARADLILKKDKRLIYGFPASNVGAFDAFEETMILSGGVRLIENSSRLSWGNSDSTFIGTKTADNVLTINAASYLDVLTETHFSNKVQFHELGTSIQGLPTGLLLIKSNSKITLDSPHVLIPQRLCLRHDPITDECLAYQQMNSDGDMEFVNKIGDILLRPSGGDVKLPDTTKLQFGDSGYIKGEGGEMRLVNTSGDIALRPADKITIPLDTKLDFGHGTTVLQQTTNAFELQSVTPLNMNVSSVKLPDNSPLVFGDSTRRIESDGDSLKIYGKDMISLESSTVKVTGTLIVNEMSTFKAGSDINFDGGIITLGGGQTQDISNFSSFSNGDKTLVTTSTPHNLRVGDNVVLVGTIPDYDGKYVIQEVPTSNSFSILTQFKEIPAGVTVEGIVRSDHTTNSGYDLGVELNWHSGSPLNTSGKKTSFFGLDRSTERWTFLHDSTRTNNVYTGTLGDIQIGTLYANAISAPNLLSSLNTGNYLVSGSNFNITGGNIDNTKIGETTPSTGTFTYLNITGGINVSNDSLVQNLNADKLDGYDSSAFIMRNGSTPLLGNWDAGAYTIKTNGLYDTSLTPEDLVSVGPDGRLKSVKGLPLVDGVLMVDKISGFKLMGDIDMNGYKIFNGNAENLSMTQSTISTTVISNSSMTGSTITNTTISDGNMTNYIIEGSSIKNSNITTSNVTIPDGYSLDVTGGNLLLRDNSISIEKLVPGGTAQFDINGNATTVTNGIYTTDFSEDYTILKADIAGHPELLHIPVNTVVGRIDGNIIPLTRTQVVNMWDLLREESFTAFSILKADTAGFPEALTIPENSIVGRINGNIVALSKNDVVTMWNIVRDESYLAHTILKADIDGEPIPLYIPENTLVGRKNGDIITLTRDDLTTMYSLLRKDDFVDHSILSADVAGNPTSLFIPEHTVIGRNDEGIVPLTRSDIIGMWNLIGEDTFGDYTILKADVAGNPVSLFIPENTIIGRKDGNIIPLTRDDLTEMYSLVRKDDYLSYTILKADANGIPIPLHIPEESIVGRKNGDIVALTREQIIQMYSLINKESFIDNSILKADTAGNPEPLTIPENTIVGRLPNGEIAALNPAEARDVLDVETMTPEVIYRNGGMMRDGHLTFPDGAKLTGLQFVSYERYTITTGQTMLVSTDVDTTYISVNYNKTQGRIATVNLGRGIADGQRKHIILSKLAEKAVLKVNFSLIAPEQPDPICMVMYTAGQSAYLQWDSVMVSWLIVGSGCEVFTADDLRNPDWVYDLTQIK